MNVFIKDHSNESLAEFPAAARSTVVIIVMSQVFFTKCVFASKGIVFNSKPTMKANIKNSDFVGEERI